MDAVTDRFRLTGKVALVTGGSRGLGREMVRAFARAGADVVITSRNAGSCAELALEVEAETGQAALAVGCHAGHWDELPGLLPYAAAKAGLNALTAGFAFAFGPAVRVNAIMAGPFFTDVSKSWDMEAFNRSAQYQALRRGGQPEEIVGAALYFASDASSYTTGAVLTVDGGLPA